MSDKFKTVIFRDVELYWAKLDTPVDTFNTGVPVYEIQMRTTDEAKANEWIANKLNVKKVEEDGKSYFKVGLKRKSVNKSGKVNPAPQVISADPSVAIDPAKIGNGSIGHVRCFQYDYTAAGKSGVGTQFNAVKIVNLKEYERDGDDFDF